MQTRFDFIFGFGSSADTLTDMLWPPVFDSGTADHSSGIGPAFLCIQPGHLRAGDLHVAAQLADAAKLPE